MVTEFIRELIPDFTKKLIYDILKWFWGLVRTAGALIILYLALFTDYFKTFDRGSLFLGLVLGGFVVASLYLGIEIYRRLNSHQPKFQSIVADFEVLEFKNIYDHTTRTRMVYTKRKKIKALRNGLSRYEDRYNWTGRGSEGIRCLDAHQTLVKTERRSTWQFYEVKFNKVLKKGDVIDVDVEWVLDDTENRAVPFMSATIEEPTKMLSLTVKFPQESNVTKVIEEVAPFIGSKAPFENVEKPVVGKEHEFKPAEVKLLHHYELRWQW